MLLADIFVTTYGRPSLLERSLGSLLRNTPRDQFRLTVVDDGSPAPTRDVISRFQGSVDYTITNGRNEGLGPSINRALAHIDSTNVWSSDPRAGDPSRVAPFICYCQDDLLYSPGWLGRLSKMFMVMERPHRLGFASGLECVEHATRQELAGGVVLKDWIRAANMFGRREFWMSMWPIPRFDPETGNVRARPNDGIGSGVDWHFVRNHENSVCMTGRTNLVIPGLVVHAGYDRSTWLSRELPESNEDKDMIGEEFSR